MDAALKVADTTVPQLATGLAQKLRDAATANGDHCIPTSTGRLAGRQFRLLASLAGLSEIEGLALASWVEGAYSEVGGCGAVLGGTAYRHHDQTVGNFRSRTGSRARPLVGPSPGTGRGRRLVRLDFLWRPGAGSRTGASWHNCSRYNGTPQ